MKMHELIRKIESFGARFYKEGGNHTKYKTGNGKILIIPRHAGEVAKGTAESIIKQARDNQ